MFVERNIDRFDVHRRTSTRSIVHNEHKRDQSENIIESVSRAFSLDALEYVRTIA
jgi:hypothetical protein